jgi:hypothetical protein
VKGGELGPTPATWGDWPREIGVIEGVWSASGEVGGVALGDQAAESEGVDGGYCEEIDGTDIALQYGSV